METNLYLLIHRYHTYCRLKELKAPPNIIATSETLLETEKSNLRLQNFNIDLFIQSNKFKQMLYNFQINEAESDAISNRCQSCHNLTIIYSPQREFTCIYFIDDKYPPTCDHFDDCCMDWSERFLFTYNRCNKCINHFESDTEAILCNLKLNDNAIECTHFNEAIP